MRILNYLVLAIKQRAYLLSFSKRFSITHSNSVQKLEQDRVRGVASSPALPFLAMFFFPLGSCIGRAREKNTSLDRFIVERVVVSFFLCTTMLTDIV